VEEGIEFLGFLVMQNKVKQATVGVIENLNECNIRTIMATGDNVLTAVSVGRECNIIDAETEVFLGDVKGEGINERVAWKSTATNTHFLDDRKLEPKEDYYSG